MKFTTKDLEYRQKAWRGHLFTEKPTSLWDNEIKDYEAGFPQLVISSRNSTDECEDEIQVMLSEIASKFEQIEKFVFECYLLTEERRGLINISGVLFPESKRYYILEISPSSQDIHESMGVVVDRQACQKKALNLAKDVAVVSQRKAADLWAMDLLDWREYSDLQMATDFLLEKKKIVRLLEFPSISQIEEKSLLGLFKKKKYAYELELNLELFSGCESPVPISIADGEGGRPVPQSDHAQAIKWIQDNACRIEEETREYLISNLSFSEEEVRQIRLTEIIFLENPLHNISFTFSSEKFDYDEHGLGVIWSYGNPSYCGHAMSCL